MSAGARLLEPLLGLDAEALAELAPSLVVVRLAPGEVLVRRGEPALHLFVVAEGRLAVDAPEGEDAPPLSIVGPGEPIGEVALVAGGARSATVRALEPCTLVRLDKSDLERLLAQQPIVQVAFADTVRRRLRRSELAEHLRPIFGGSEPQALAELEPQVEWLALPSGATLFRRGDPGDAAYVITSGRLRALDADDAAHALNEIGTGEIVGEMALLEAEPRSASVVAVRDSLLARIPASAFHRLIERHPAALRRITGFLIARLRMNGARQPKRPEVRTLTLVPAGPGVDLSAFASRLAEALAAHGATLVLDARSVDAALGRSGAAAAGERDPVALRLVQWLDEQERSHRFLLYVGDEAARAWTERAVRQADHVLFVAAASDPPEPGELERALAARWRGAGAPRRSLVLVREPGAGEPKGTAAWLDARDAGRHYHVRADARADFARLARCAIGAGVGLVLGGGGARGFAHLGVLRALGEAGVPIDWVGGTSVGAILAGAVALGLSPEEAAAQCREQFARVLDPTLPLVSLLAGRRIRARLESGFGERQIEDLPLPFQCVSTNLSRATQTVHERGGLARAVRASISLPGILPPVLLGSDLHVDGALVNNLPVDVMASLPEIGHVIAVDVSPEVEMRAQLDVSDGVSGWRVLWQRLSPFGSRAEVPMIANVLTRSSVVASIHSARDRDVERAASLYLRLPVSDLKLLAFEHVDEIAARGYEASIEAIRAWSKEPR